MEERNGVNNLYEAIFHRKSVRKYESAPLAGAELDEVNGRLETLRPLYDGQRAAFRVLLPAGLKGMISAKAPHYLAVYAHKRPEALVGAAFMAQQMDLWLSANGLGSCWLGMPGPTQDAAEADGLPFAIALAFGRPAEDARRADATAFKRKPLSEITDLTGMDALVEPVRLAPSGMNRQAWFVSGDARVMRLYGKRNGAISKALYGAMPYIDMGIALCHLQLGAEAAGRFEALEKERDPAAAPRGYEYVWSVRLNEDAQR